jgi:hypothetical protein
MIAAWGGSEDAAWGSRSSARWLPVWVFLVGACFTACVYLLPGDMFDVAYRSVSLRVASEAFGSLAGLAFAYLVVGRARGGPCLADYLVAAAFIVAAVDNIVTRRASRPGAPRARASSRLPSSRPQASLPGANCR